LTEAFVSAINEGVFMIDLTYGFNKPKYSEKVFLNVLTSLQTLISKTFGAEKTDSR
jgi:hypothetical protein